MFLTAICCLKKSLFNILNWECIGRARCTILTKRSQKLGINCTNLCIKSINKLLLVYRSFNLLQMLSIRCPYVRSNYTVNPKYAFIPFLMQIYLLTSLLFNIFEIQTKKTWWIIRNVGKFLGDVHYVVSNFWLFFRRSIWNIIMYGE